MNNFKKIPQDKLEEDFSWLTNNIRMVDNISVDRVNSILKNNVLKDILIEKQYRDLYINSFEKTVYIKNNKDAYVDFANQVRETIHNNLKSNGINMNKNKITYTTVRLEKTEDFVKYMVFFISPSIPISGINIISQYIMDDVLRAIISLYFKTKLLSKKNSAINILNINEQQYITSYFEIDEKDNQEGILYCVEPKISIKKGIINVKMFSSSFKASAKEGVENKMLRVPEMIYSHDGLDYKIVDKVDARTYNVNHILLDANNFKTTKLGFYINSVEIINEILSDLHIEYQNEVMKVDEVYHNLFKMDENNYKKDIYLCIEKNDYDFLINQKYFKNEIIGLKEVINEEYPDINIIDHIFEKEPVIENGKLYLCITLKNSYKDHYIYDGEKSLNNENVHKIVLFNKNYDNLDWYTKVKKNILINNISGKNFSITQGLVIRKDLKLFGVIKEPKDNDKNKKNDKLVNIVKKTINELLLKELLFKTKSFKIDDYSFKSVKIMKKFPCSNNQKNNKKIKYVYGLIEAKINNNNEIEIINKKLSSEDKTIEEIWEYYQLGSINDEDFFTSTFMIIDDKYVIKIKNNNFNPIPIGSSNMLIDEDLNPLKTTKRSMKTKKTLSKEQNIDDDNLFTNNLSKSIKGNLFSFYNLGKIRKILGCKEKIDTYYLLEFKNKDVLYCCIDKNTLNKSIAKINRVEALSLFEIDDFDIKKIDIERNRYVLDFYLSLTTENLIKVNSYSKVTILEKMLNILWDN